MMESREREEQYRVSIDWLYDMEDYNEWMFEEDYEVQTLLAPHSFALTSHLPSQMFNFYNICEKLLA